MSRRSRVNRQYQTGVLAGAAVLVAVLVMEPPHAHAQSHSSLRHRVKRGDTIPLLAAEYYGDRRHAIFIMVANGMDHDRPLKPGERLNIPMNREVTVAPGDTLESLAEQYLGDPRRAPFLASFNDLDTDASLAAGQILEVPLHVVHKAAGKESISSIAAAYFATRKKAKLIRAYNFIDKKFLEAGETVVIPIYHVKMRRSRRPPPDKESQKRVEKRAEMQKLALQSVRAARAAWRAGDYAGVKRELTRIDTDYLDADLATDVGVLLGSTYVAFGDADSALASFRKVLERRPGHELDAYYVSPKILDVWKRAGGAVKLPNRTSR